MASSKADIPRTWWKQAVIYQIFPASFKDSNGDGLGDIQGIISKIDYIASLGVDAIWLSPCYKSPQVDMGYDISDYRQIHEPYGTIEDVEILIDELKKRGIRLLMDLVINHTSNEHSWFLESKSSVDNPKRNWYIWRKGKTGPNGEKLPPNNWQSLFMGGAWEYDEGTDEYYFHVFASAQPDLNWENPEVREAIYADIDFWLKKGVAGFRMDAINLISKPKDFPDAPEGQRGFETCCSQVYNRPQVHEWLSEMKTKTFNNYVDLVSIGECAATHDVEEIMRYIHPDRNELDMIFSFGVGCIDFGNWGVFSRRDWDLGMLKRTTNEGQNQLRPHWNTWHTENHDSGRSVNRYGLTSSPEHFPAVSKLLAFHMMTVGGTIFLYQGQEFGAPNLTEEICLYEYKDMLTHDDINNHRVDRQVSQGKIDVDMSDVKREVLLKARDHARVPLAWDGSEGAGFTTGKPWMTLGTTYKKVNVADQENDPDSVLSTWREMVLFRKQNPEELVYGSFELIDEGHQQIFAYTRTAKGGGRILVALNWSDRSVSWETPSTYGRGRVLKTVGGVEFSGGKVHMFPYACVAWRFCCWWC